MRVEYMFIAYIGTQKLLHRCCENFKLVIGGIMKRYTIYILFFQFLWVA